MDIEVSEKFTYEKLLSHYNHITSIDLDFLAKTVDKRLLIEVTPPFILTKLDAKAYIPFDMLRLLEIWTSYNRKEFPKASIDLEYNNICNLMKKVLSIVYITRYEETLMLAKNGEEEMLYFIGKFAPGELIIVSHAGPTTEKILRLKVLMNFYNAIQEKLKQNEKKKETK